MFIFASMDDSLFVVIMTFSNIFLQFVLLLGFVTKKKQNKYAFRNLSVSAVINGVDYLLSQTRETEDR